MQNGGIAIEGTEIRAFAETDPSALPWKELGVDVVIESTGRFRTRAGAEQASRGRRSQGDHLGARQGHRAA